MNAPDLQLAHAAGLDLLLRIDERLSPALAGSASAAHTAPRIVAAIGEPMGWACGAFWSRDADVADRLACVGAWGIDSPGISGYLSFTHTRRPILNNAGLVGAAWLGAQAVWVADMASDTTFRRVPIAMRAGLRSALAFPVIAGGQVLGVVELCSTGTVARNDTLLAGLRLVGGQIGQFLLRAQTQAQLLDSEKRLRCLTTLSSDWYWEQDAQARFVRFEGHGAARNAAALAPALIGRCLWEVPGLVPGSSDWDAHRAKLELREPYRDFEFVCRDARGDMVHLSANGDPIHDADGLFTGYRGTARDITAQRQAAQRIQYLSTHDEVTALPTRAALRQLVTQALEVARRYERRFGILLLDIDSFQRMNDSLGRETADALLRELGARLRKALRASDIVARADGDAFAVLAHELPASQHAEPIARKLQQVLSEPITIGGEHFRLSACAGIATYPDHAQDEPSLMKQAELALRAAKRQGPGSLHVADAISKPA